MESIDELVELFRRSGGIFENIEIGYRDESGFYGYTLDRNQDTVVLCPAHLLVETDDIGVSEDGLYISNSSKYGKNIEFLEKYFSFHFNRKMLDRYIEKKRQIDSLSSRDISLISSVYPSDLHLLEVCGELEFAKKAILQSYRIGHFGKNVIMPFVSLLNYDKNGKPFDIKEGAISVSGKFSDEVGAAYNNADVIMFAGYFGFIADTRFVYSLPMSKVAPNGTRVVINRDPRVSTKPREGYPLPQIRKDRGVVKISWFPLYFEWGHQYPAMVAHMVARETGLPAELVLYEVFHSNLKALIPVAFQLRESKNQYARLAGAAAQRQLEVISGMWK